MRFQNPKKNRQKNLLNRNQNRNRNPHLLQLEIVVTNRGVKIIPVQL